MRTSIRARDMYYTRPPVQRTASVTPRTAGPQPETINVRGAYYYNMIIDTRTSACAYTTTTTNRVRRTSCRRCNDRSIITAGRSGPKTECYIRRARTRGAIEYTVCSEWHDTIIVLSTVSRNRGQYRRWFEDLQHRVTARTVKIQYRYCLVKHDRRVGVVFGPVASYKSFDFFFLFENKHVIIIWNIRYAHDGSKNNSAG